MLMGLEEDEFILAEKRHRELIKAVKSAFANMPEQKLDLSPIKEIKDSVEKLSDSLDAMVSKIKPVEPQAIDLTPLVEAIGKMESNMTRKLDEVAAVMELYNQPRELELDFERRMGDGKISGVKGRQYFKTIGKA